MALSWETEKKQHPGWVGFLMVGGSFASFQERKRQEEAEEWLGLRHRCIPGGFLDGELATRLGVRCLHPGNLT